MGNKDNCICLQSCFGGGGHPGRGTVGPMLHSITASPVYPEVGLPRGVLASDAPTHLFLPGTYSLPAPLHPWLSPQLTPKLTHRAGREEAQVSSA